MAAPFAPDAYGGATMRAVAGKRDAAVVRNPRTASAAPLPEAAQIDRGQPIPDQVYRLLRQSIITLRLPPGATIIEKQITDRLGISRTPVRDALRQLADEGLVTIKPQSGTFVALIDRLQLEEGRVVRRALEIEAIKLAAKRADDAAIEHLTDLLALQERAGKRNNYEAFIAYDDQFHRTINELSGLPRLWRVISGAKAQLDRVRHLSAPLPGQSARVLAQHRAVVAALARRDPEACIKALGHHLDDAYDRITILLKKHGELFH
jgi:GntR family transcriptional regulator, rspAB operon transcriptional repressor